MHAYPYITGYASPVPKAPLLLTIAQGIPIVSVGLHGIHKQH